MPAIFATEAKQSFGRMLDGVARGESYTIFRRNRPVARVVPISASPEASQFGALSAYASDTRRPLEKGEFKRAMEAKHAAR